jgi:uncharacterized protein (TIGR02001 family)
MAHISRFLILAGLAGAALIASTARAEDGPKYPIISGTAAVVSDYRFRGVSFSNKDPAVQASIQLTTKPGFFIAAWGSSIANYGGANTEIDFYGGWTGPVGPFAATVGVYSYLYPGGRNVDTYELYGSLGYTIGPVAATVGVNFSPDQKNLNRSSRYAYLNLAAAIPNTPITLKANVGHEQGSFVVDLAPVNPSTSKFDYLLGADIKWRALTLGLAFIGNDLQDQDGFNNVAKNNFFISVTAAF